MRLEEVYEEIAEEHQGLLSSFEYYICTSLRKIESDLQGMSINSLCIVVKDILKKVRYSNIDLMDIESEIIREAEMIKCFRESFYLSGENFESIGAGHNNGLIRNTVEEDAIKKMEKTEEMQNKQLERYAKRDMLKKSLDDNNKLIYNVISLIPNELYQKVVRDAFVNGMTMPQLAQKYNIAYDSVGKYKERGISSIAKIFKFYLNCQVCQV